MLLLIVLLDQLLLQLIVLPDVTTINTAATPIDCAPRLPAAVANIESGTKLVIATIDSPARSAVVSIDSTANSSVVALPQPVRPSRPADLRKPTSSGNAAGFCAACCGVIVEQSPETACTAPRYRNNPQGALPQAIRVRADGQMGKIWSASEEV